jgi:hypothetical protein
MDAVSIDRNLKQDLESRYYELRQKVTGPESKYFHLHTLENLIYHFDDIKTEADKVWAYMSLSKYFEACQEYIEHIDKKKGAELFHNHLFNVAMFYREKLSFALLIDTFYLVSIYFALFLVLYFTTFFWLSLIPVVLFLIHYLYNFRKYQQRRLYGLFF